MSIQQNLKVSFSTLNSNYISCDENVCRIIASGMLDDLKLCLENGLNPNYILQKDVKVESLLFKEGSSLIFIIVQCCTFVSFPWDHLAMINLLLEKKVDLEIKNPFEGSSINVLEYACENEELILEDIILTLLKAASAEAIYFALNKVKRVHQRDKIKKILLLEKSSYSFSNVELEALFSDHIPSLCASEVDFLQDLIKWDEEEICRCIVEGNEGKFRGLLDSGLNPNYVFSKNFYVNDFFCEEGISLLLLVLKYCVEKKASSSRVEFIALLLERNVDLEQDSCGIYPLNYLCENEVFFSEDIILCLLTSVSKEKAFCALKKVENCRCKQLEAKLLSNEIFQFKEICLEKENQQDQLSVSFPNNFLLDREEVLDTIEEEINQEAQGIMLNKDEILLQEESLLVSYSAEDRIKELSLQICENNFIGLKTLLKNVKQLEELDLSLKIHEETLFSTLIQKIKTPNCIHEVCSLFLQNNFSPKTLVYKNMNMVSFLCFLRNKQTENRKSKIVLMDTICLALLFSEEALLVEHMNVEDKNKLQLFFIDDNIRFSKKKICISKIISKSNYKPLSRAFIEVSTFLKKNLSTDQPWGIKDILFLLDNLVTKLYYKTPSILNPKKKEFRIYLFKTLLISGLKLDCFQEEKAKLCISWIKSIPFPFRSSEVETIILSLLRTYWGQLVDNSLVFSSEEQTSSLSFNFSYKFQIDLIMSKILEGNFEELKVVLKNKDSLKQCNDHIKSTDGENTLFSVLMSKIKEAKIRHQICYLFFEYGLEPGEVVYQKKNVVEFLCDFRSRYYVVMSNNYISFETICLSLFLSQDNDLIKRIIAATSFQDSKKLHHYFMDENFNIAAYGQDLRSFSNLVGNIYYTPLIKAFIEASVITNKNIITKEPLEVEGVLCFLDRLVDKFLNFFQSERRTCKRNRRILLEFFEFLLKISISPRLFKEEKIFSYSSFIKKVHCNLNKLEKEFSLIKTHWRSVIDIDKVLQEEKKITVNKNDFDVQKKLLELSLEIGNNNFTKLEEILENKTSLEGFEQEIKLISNGKETCFSIIMSSIRNASLRHKIYLLFLKHNLPSEEIVYDNMNILRFLCYLRTKFYQSEDISLQTICLAFLINKSSYLEILAINECPELDKKKIISFFQYKSYRDFFNKVSLDIFHIPFLKAFVEGSTLVNRDLLSGDTWNFGELFFLLIMILKKLSVFKKKSIAKTSLKKRESFLGLLEVILISSVKLDLKENYNEDRFNEINEIVRCFINLEIKESVIILFQKYWDVCFENRVEKFSLKRKFLER